MHTFVLPKRYNMEHLKALIYPEEIRMYLRDYLKAVLHISVRKYIQQHPSLTDNMFLRDTKRSTSGERSRVMDIRDLHKVCQVMNISLWIQRGDRLTHSIALVLSDASQSLVRVANLSPKKANVVNDDTEVYAKSLGSLVSQLTSANSGSMVVMRFDDYDLMDQTTAVMHEPNDLDQVMVTYVRSIEQYQLLLRHLVYYTRQHPEGVSYLRPLVRYIIVLPSRKMMVNTQPKGKKELVMPFGVRMFAIDMSGERPIGPAPNQTFARWGYTHYDQSHAHEFVYIKNEVADYSIDQAQGADHLLHLLQNTNYAPTYTTIKALRSAGVLNKKWHQVGAE